MKRGKREEGQGKKKRVKERGKEGWTCSTCLQCATHTFSFSSFFGTAVARDIKRRRGNVAAPEAARLKGNEKRDGVDGRMGVGRGAKGMQREGSGNY